MKIEIKLEYRSNDTDTPWCASTDTPFGYLCVIASTPEKAEKGLIAKAKIAIVKWRPPEKKEVEI